MLNKTFFKKYQKILLVFSNTFIGRYILRINGERSSVGTNKIIGILPNAILWKGKKENEYIAEFRTHNKFGKRLYYAFKPLWYLFHYWDLFIANIYAPKLNLGFDSTGNLFPASGANSPVDGYVARDVAAPGETFATIRGGAGNISNVTDASQTIPILTATTTADQYSQIYRDIITWDTSSIAGGTVTAATASLATKAPTAKTNGLGSPDIHCAGATPASNSNLVNADYGQVQTTSFANVTYANWSTVDGTYNDFALNASGLSNISVTGISRFSFQTSWDINNSFTGIWASGAQSYFNHNYADAAGTSADPKLVVTYNPGGSFLLNFI